MKNKSYLLLIVFLLGLSVCIYYKNQSYAIETFEGTGMIEQAEESYDEIIGELENFYAEIVENKGLGA